MPSCTAGRSRPTTRSSTRTRTTCAASTSRCGPSTPRAVRIGVAGHNLFDIAYAGCSPGERRRARRPSSSRCCSAWPRARSRRSRARSGTCCSTCRSCVPTSSTSRSATSCAASRRTRRARTSSRAAFELADDPAMFERERDRFLASIDRAARPGSARPGRTARRTARAAPAAAVADARPARSVTPGRCGRRRETARRDRRRSDAGGARHRPHRGRRPTPATPRRSSPSAPRSSCSAETPSSRRPCSRRARPTTARVGAPGFRNAARHRPVAARRTATWARDILARIEASTAGDATIAAARVDRRRRARGDRRAGSGCRGGLGRAARGRACRRAAEAAARALEARRGELIEVAASETGKVLRRGGRRGERGRRLRELLRRDGARARPRERCGLRARRG